MESTRRDVLRGGAGALAGAGLAGCLDDAAVGSPGGAASGYAAFFALWDWAERVAGDALAFENPVEVGQAGHGWSPDADVTRDVAASDVFVYLDTPEFAWAQDVAATLERDYDDVVVVDGLEGIDLLEWDHDHGDEDEHAGDGGERGDDHDGGHDDEGREGDHGTGNETAGSEGGANYDPHVWTDPVRAREIVDTIAAGLSTAVPDDADQFEENAAAYGDRLETLDETFRELIADAERTEAVLAGHDSYRYLEDRYGFDLRTPVGLAPGDRPSQSEVADTIEFVDDRGIETILYDRFESPTLAETIVENSDATEIAPIASGEGTTAEWRDEGWGYVEQVREVTVPALRRALGS